jgi:ABC-type uncharacterized transport system auxiliary subunit
MSKIVKVSNSNYKVSVQSGGTITLDTGNQTGTVYVSGDLIVQGNTTTVESETLTVTDNVIVVNNGEGGPGITLNEAGVQVDRGSKDDAQLFFMENVSYYSPTTANFKEGTFVFKDTTGLLRGIRTNSINTSGGKLALINQGTGVVTVTGTTNYHDQVQYGSDPDVLVTRQWVQAYVNSSGYTGVQGGGIAIVDRLYNSDTGLQAYDTSTSAGTSRIELKFDNVVKSTLSAASFTINTTVNVNSRTQITNNTISASQAGDNLVLTPASGKNIEIASPLQLNDTSAPSSVSGATKLYVTSSNSNTGTGKTGIYFTNQSNSDELIAKNRALLWSMLF